jgi:hypothetical protein
MQGTDDRKTIIQEEEMAQREISSTTPRRAEGRGSDRPLLMVMGVAFLPWLIVVLITAGPWPALHIAGYAAIALSVGYCFIKLALPQSRGVETIFLSPALGILISASLGGLWLRLGLPLIWVPLLWLVPAATGALYLWRDRSWLRKQTVAYGWTLALLSLLVCLVYFVPSARKDAVLRQDGSFRWMYVDTQHFYAIAAGIKGDERPPVGPGSATEPLLYHFAPYVPAAVLSRVDGLGLGDALARVTRGASMWALVLSCFGFGTLLSLRATGEKFGGIMSVAGLFFYGSLLSLFSNETNSASHVTGAILVTIPGVEVLADGGPFSHIILGHSVLHGMVAITAVLGLCLMYRSGEADLRARSALLLLLPALVAPVNSVSALYCIGAAGILLFWSRLKNMRTWLAMLAMATLLAAAWKVMGYSHAPDAALATMNWSPGSQWWSLTVGFLAGLGFRIIGFRWISRPLKDPVALMVLVTFVGLLGFTVFLRLSGGNQRYGIYFLECMFSIFAFSRLRRDCWRANERTGWVAEWMTVAKWGMLLLGVGGAIIGIVAYFRHHVAATKNFGPKVVLVILIAALLAGTAALMRNRQLAVTGSSIMMAILLAGFLAWMTPWLNFGVGRMKMDVTVSSEEVRGLHRLRELAPPRERFATNKRDVDTLADRRARSYGYAGLSERPVLLEGYLDREVTVLPWFPKMQHDNDLMFTTADASTLHDLARAWNVQWLVARPGTDISLPRPLPEWLIEENNCGSLKIYQVN